MSKTSETPETTSPKTSKFAALSNLKPSTMDDEKKETIKRRAKFAIAYTCAFVAGALTTVAIVNAKTIIDDAEAAKEELTETEESTED